MDNLPRNTSAVVSAAAVVVIIYGMQAAKVLLVPFLLAVFLALITVKVHRGRAMRKLGAGNAAELGRIASKTGIVQPS